MMVIDWIKYTVCQQRQRFQPIIYIGWYKEKTVRRVDSYVARTVISPMSALGRIL